MTRGPELGSPGRGGGTLDSAGFADRTSPSTWEGNQWGSGAKKTSPVLRTSSESGTGQGYKSQPHLFLAGSPGASFLTSLSLRFLLCE